jgi:hypothetical protein
MMTKASQMPSQAQHTSGRRGGRRGLVVRVDDDVHIDFVAGYPSASAGGGRRCSFEVKGLIAVNQP